MTDGSGSGNGRKTWTDGGHFAALYYPVFTILPIFLLVFRTEILGFSRRPSTQLHITNVDYCVATWIYGITSK